MRKLKLLLVVVMGFLYPGYTGYGSEKPSPERALTLLKEGNARFVAGEPKHPRTDISRMNRGGHAYAMVITYSDSRVPVERPFDLILMDMQMPEMDGLDAARAIRQFNADIPILAMSADRWEEIKHECRAAGMNGHLGKPIEFDQLSAVIAGVFE